MKVRDSWVLPTVRNKKISERFHLNLTLSAAACPRSMFSHFPTTNNDPDPQSNIPQSWPASRLLGCNNNKHSTALRLTSSLLLLPSSHNNHPQSQPGPRRPTSTTSSSLYDSEERDHKTRTAYVRRMAVASFLLGLLFSHWSTRLVPTPVLFECCTTLI